MELKIGDKAPLFCLPNQDNAEVCLRDFKGMWVIVYFYPKDKTPSCTQEACDFRDNLQSLESLGAVVLGISPDSPKTHQSFIDKESLNFTLLSDTTKETLKAYGAWGTKKLYGKEYEGVIRSSFIINPKGEIAYLWRQVKVKGHIKALQEKLKALQEA